MKMSRLLRRTLFVTIVVAIFAISFVGCSKNLTANTDSLYVPTAADVTSGASLADLQAGRSIFINDCGRCHSLYSPDSYSASNWKTIIPNMAGRAGLSATQATQVTKYVTRGK